MENGTKRRLSAVVGAFLLVVAAGVVALSRGALLKTPALAAQTGLVATAGLLDVAAGFDTRLTELVPWYKLSGLGNVFLGFSLPFASVGATEPLLLIVTVLGGLSLAGMGVDMLLFDGRHVYSEPLD